MRCIAVFLVWLLTLPLMAQVNNEEVEVQQDDDEKVDSADIVSLGEDTLKSLPWPVSVQRKISKLLESKMFETSQVGLMVWDLKSDSCIYAYRQRQLMRPASCMKLVTAITALDKLGGSYQFKTTLKYTGHVENHVLNGDIYVIGGMDPRFNSDDLTSFVNSIKEMGIDTIRGNLYADKSMKDSDPYGEGWCWDDKNPTLTPLLLSRKDDFMDRFLKKLDEAGIYYTSYSAKERRCPSDAFTISTRTHSIDQVLGKMLKESDNLYAESTYYQIAASTGNRPASARSARQVERQLIQRIGLDPSRYRLADGSGLSLYNYVSAELLVRLLRYAYQQGSIFYHLYQSLPIAGVDGTLKKRMKGSFTCGNVHAKTGTLEGIISLAGYCKASNGDDLCFAIINNGIMHGNNARTFADRVCEAMCMPQ